MKTEWRRIERKDGATRSTADNWKTAEGRKYFFFLMKENTLIDVLYSVGSGKSVRVLENAKSMEISANLAANQTDCFASIALF